jgi:hypothetical protein
MAAWATFRLRDGRAGYDPPAALPPGAAMTPILLASFAACPAPKDGVAPEPTTTDSGVPTPTTGTTPTGTEAGTWTEGADTVTVEVVAGVGTLARTYHLATTHPLRDGAAPSRTVTELPDQPVLRSGDLLFDALFALAVEEARENSVDEISDGAFGGGALVPCRCFRTGELWTWVWTRDTAYATDLGLGWLDPERARDSLLFKLSAPRGGGAPQLVQDTGSGGSWPVSTDRVVWALGARKLLQLLPPSERADFRDQLLPALIETLEVDRRTVFDPRDGLYRGEQSFLDWREQSYPSWTAADTAHIAMSKALSTNVAHLVSLRLAAELSAEVGDGALAARYGGWADALAADVDERTWTGEGWATVVGTELDPSLSGHRDWLGTSLAALELDAPDHAASAVGAYPHGVFGPPVLWPQQPFVPIYHNRAIWPFVTAYGLKAARTVGNGPVADVAVASLVRGAALNLSNLENLELQTGANWVEDGPYSGPVINSRRQLWSVAGYVSMVVDVVFGVDPSGAALEARPFVTPWLRDGWLAGADEVVLHRLPFRGDVVDVRLVLPPVGASAGTLERVDHTFDGAVLTVTLGAGEAAPAARTDFVDDGDFRRVFAPREPTVTNDGGVLTLGAAGEEGVNFDVYRDGEVAASGVSGPTWVDPRAGEPGTRCYSAASVFPETGHRSQHAPPTCDWGPGYTQITSLPASSFVSSGGALVWNHGREHYEGWGSPDHTLEATFTATSTGRHYLQAVYGNGAGPVNTGITCAHKRIEVFEGATLVDAGWLVMPHLGDWGRWADSTLAPVELVAGRSYRLVVSDGPNMSTLAHFANYAGTGGASGPYNDVNIAELKVLALD